MSEIPQLIETVDAPSADVTDDAAATIAADVGVESPQPSPADGAPTVAKPSGIKPPASRIGRPCTGHGAPKAGPPPLPEPSPNDPTTMRRQPDEYSRSSHLADVYEESEAELLSERTDRSTKSRTPSEAGSSLGGGRSLKGDRKISIGSMNSEHYLEATGKRRNSDQSVVLTADTDSFIIGQRIWVGGQRPGHIAYIGETHFAPGDWAGIVLDDPSGKNDGCVSGKRYFQCEPKRGIFSRLTRLTREPLAQPSTPGESMATFGSMSMSSPSRSGAVSPSHSVRSYATSGIGMNMGRSPGKGNLSVGDRIIVSSGLGSRPGILKYIGETHFASGTWCGVQLDEPSGKNDGSVDNKHYFECPPNYGIFVPIAKVSLSPSSRKATRLSRSGSKESLTSVGTIGSMASTVTSRMRQSGVQQRLSTPAKPLTTSKHTVALQDILREKQNHIEQLLLERETEKQEAESQIIAYQKDINQLKETVGTLEKRLLVESKRTEDLQVSIEEATFCGDELNAQTQDYRERIAKLEAQLAQHQTTTAATNTADAERHHTEMRQLADELAMRSAAQLSTDADLRQRTEELAALAERHKDAEAEWTIKLSSLGVSEQCLREEIRFFQSENEQLKTELRAKDESTEKEYLAMRHIEHELKEELVAAQTQLQLRDATLADNDGELQRLVAERDAQLAEMRSKAVGSEQVHELELNKLKAELQQLRDQLSEATQANQTQSSESSELTAQIQRHRDEIAAHKQTICETSALVVRLQNEAVAAQEKSEAQTQKIKEHTETVLQLRTEAEQMQRSNTDWSTKFDNLQQSASNLSDVVLRQRDDTIAQLNETVARNVAEVNRLTEHQKQLDEQIEGLRTEASNKEALNGRLQLANQQLEAELAELKAGRDADAQKAAELAEVIANVERQKSAGDSQIGAMLEDIAELKRTLDALRAENEQLRQELNEKTGAIHSMTTEAEERAAEITHAKQDTDTVRHELTARSADLEKATKQIGDLHSKLEQAHSEAAADAEVLASLQVDHADLQRQQQMLAAKLEQAHAERTSLQQNLDTLQSSSSDTSSEVHRLRDELLAKQRLHDELVDRSNGAQLALERRVHEQTQEMAAQVAQAERRSAELTALGAQKIERENELNAELSQMKEAAEGVREALQKECAGLRVQFGEERERLVREFEDKQAEAERQRQELDGKVTELQTQLKSLDEASASARSDWTTQETVLNSRVAQLSETESELRIQITTLSESESSLRERLSGSSEASAAEISQLQTQIKKLNEATLAAQTSREQHETSLNDRIAQLSQTEASLRLQLTALTESERILRESLQNSGQSSAAQITELTTALQQSQATATASEAAAAQLRTDLADCTARLEQLAAEQETQQLTFAAEVEQLTLQLTEVTARNVLLDEQFKTTEDDQVDLVNKNLEMIEEIQLLRQQLSEAADSQTEIGAQLTERQTEAVELQKRCDELGTQLTTKTGEHDALQATLVAVRAELAAAEEKTALLSSSANLSDDLKNELCTKAEELRTKDATIATLGAEVAALKESVTAQAAASSEAAALLQREHQKEVDGLQEKLERLEVAARDAADASVGERETMAAELQKLRSQIEAQQTQFAERLRVEFVERASFEALRDELAAMAEVKQTEVRQLMGQLEAKEEMLAGQSAAVEQLAVVQRREKELGFEKVALQRREEQLQMENRQLSEKLTKAVATEVKNVSEVATTVASVTNDDTGAQIAFLNSIIADMQKKNENLLLRISALEESPQDFIKNSLYDVPIRREPAPRMFCDICDIFDAHETEDCPLQSSDTPSPPPPPSSTTASTTNGGKERKIPPPRKYCDLCETFGHEAAECEADETY